MAGSVIEAPGAPAAPAAVARGAGIAGPEVLGRVPPPALFITGAVSQYTGSALAVLLFASVPAAGVAWLRVAAAAGVLVAWRRPWRAAWTRRRLVLAGTFGIVLGCMNLCFYLAIARLPLGTTVAIEFIGPVAVAALGSRTRRDGAALALAALGVGLLADVRIAGSPLGVTLALVAGCLWAAYIVLGHRVAADRALAAQDGLAAGMAVGAIVLLPIVGWRAADAFGNAGLLAACIGVGVLASVVPYALEQLSMRRLPRARFALLLALLPATAALMGAIVLGQVPSVAEGIGIALVVAATALGSHAAE